MKNIKLVDNYIRALYRSSEYSNGKKILAELNIFKKLLEENPRLNEVLNSKLFSKDIKINILKNVADRLKLSLLLIRFFILLIKNERVNLLNDIIENYRKFLAKANNVQLIKLYSSKYLTQLEKDRIENILSKNNTIKLEIDYHQEPKLLGGVVIEHNNVQQDYSLRGAIRILKHLRK